MNDLITYNRHAEAEALRRLADTALAAAAVLTDPEALPGDEHVALVRVRGRVESVKHAHVVLEAARAGARRAAA